MDAHDPSSTEARLLVLEMSVAALIAQLPPQSLEEVTGLLYFVAETTEGVEGVTGTVGDRQLGHVRYWAREMLGRMIVSRKASRPDPSSPASSPPA